MRFILTFILAVFLLPISSLFAQKASYFEGGSRKVVDSLYREDQFFVGITYNNLLASPKGYSNDKIAAGFTAGAVRDIPINKSRTLAFATGLGLTYNKYNHNLGITGNSSAPVYTFLATGSYSKNSLSMLSVDLPLEFRWRNSTFESTKFWRIYGGVQLNYLLYNRSLFESSIGNQRLTNNKDFAKWGYSVYLASGFNTFNIYLNYRLNNLLQGAQLNGQDLKLNHFNVGLIFYIL